MSCCQPCASVLNECNRMLKYNILKWSINWFGDFRHVSESVANACYVNGIYPFECRKPELTQFRNAATAIETSPSLVCDDLRHSSDTAFRETTIVHVSAFPAAGTRPSRNSLLRETRQQYIKFPETVSQFMNMFFDSPRFTSWRTLLPVSSQSPFSGCSIRFAVRLFVSEFSQVLYWELTWRISSLTDGIWRSCRITAFGTYQGASVIKHKAFGWNRSRISMVEMDAEPQSCIPWVQIGSSMAL
jgi:hypothetical protein